MNTVDTNTPPTDHLPAPLRAALIAEIDPGETLRWCGQPCPRHAYRRHFPIACIGVMMCLIICTLLSVLAYSTWRELQGLEPLLERSRDRPSMASVWLCGFLALVTAAVAIGAIRLPWLAAAKARKTVYALTNTRILIIEPLAQDRVRVDAVEPGHPLHITRKDIGENRGDVLIHPRERNVNALLSLHGIADARHVERLIRATFDPPK